MAKRIAKFEKVSFAQFEAAWKDTFEETDAEKIQKIYDGIVSGCTWKKSGCSSVIQEADWDSNTVCS